MYITLYGASHEPVASRRNRFGAHLAGSPGCGLATAMPQSRSRAAMENARSPGVPASPGPPPGCHTVF